MRFVAVIVAGVVLMWLTLAVTLAMIAPAANPRLVLSLWPAAATAKNVAAWNLLTAAPDDDPASMTTRASQASTLAGAALSREPVMAEAASTIGAAFDTRLGDPRTVTAFTLAERLSRRDLRAQLWLIEHAVAQGDVRSVLRHYDIALRTRPTSGALLLPVLARASNDIAVRESLITMLRRKPSWRTAYFQALLQSPPGAVAIADQFARTGLDPSDEIEGKLLSDSLEYMIQAGQYRLAAATLPKAGAQPGNGLRNGGFETMPALLPFDWWMNTDADLAAYREPGADGDSGYVLRITSDSRGGQAARQLVTLSAGRYTLDGMTGSNGEAGTALPAITVSCADSRTPLAASVLTAAASGTRKPFAFDFTVPANGCTAQWIAVEIPLGASVAAWIDTLHLRRA